MTQIKRSAGQSAVAAAAYRAGEKLHSEYYGEISDYTRKGGVICSEILLPSHAPPEYADRETLWNAVEKAERGKKAQLAYKEIQSELSPLHADAKKLWAIHYNIYEVQHEQERQNTATRQKKQEIEH